MAQKSSSSQRQKKANGENGKKNGQNGSKFRNGTTIDDHYKLKPKADKESSSSKAETKPKSKESFNIDDVLDVIGIVLNIIVALAALSIGVLLPPQRIMMIHQSFTSEEPVPKQQKQVQRKLEVDDTESKVFQPMFPCDDAALSNFLHVDAVPGMHVVCFSPDEEFGGTAITYFAGSMETDDPEKVVMKDADWSWPSLKQSLSQNLLLTPADVLHQPWAVFAPDGKKIFTEDAPESASVDIFKNIGMAIVFKGGQWFWPGVKKGYRRVIRLDGQNNATLETLSLKPLVLSVHGFLTEEECSHIRDLAEPQMRYSEVTLMDHDAGRPASDFRTSKSTFLPAKTPILKGIDERTASLVRMPKSHQEYAQVLRYGNTEKYDTHLDYFDPKLYKNDKRTLAMIENGRKNRMATVFWYLTDVTKGGETVFPRLDGAEHPASSLDCTIGLRVKPERGKVIIFYSMTPDGEMDVYSLHGACPVVEGVKWASNKWVWNSPMGYVRD